MHWLPNPPLDGALLSADEIECLELLGRVAGLLKRITTPAGGDYSYDWNEAAAYIHVLQRMIGSQAAARAYPEHFRRLGKLMS